MLLLLGCNIIVNDVIQLVLMPVFLLLWYWLLLWDCLWQDWVAASGGAAAALVVFVGLTLNC